MIASRGIDGGGAVVGQGERCAGAVQGGDVTIWIGVGADGGHGHLNDSGDRLAGIRAIATPADRGEGSEQATSEPERGVIEDHRRSY